MESFVLDGRLTIILAILLMLVAQVVMVLLWAGIVVFRAMGATYDALSCPPATSAPHWVPRRRQSLT
jgi:sodium--glutamate symport carrier gltS